MNREEAKKMAQSRNCRCVKGKDRDNNYAECIDKIFDWHESEIKKLTMHDKIIFPTSKQVENVLDRWSDRHESYQDYDTHRGNVEKAINAYKRLVSKENNKVCHPSKVRNNSQRYLEICKKRYKDFTGKDYE